MRCPMGYELSLVAQAPPRARAQVVIVLSALAGVIVRSRHTSSRPAHSPSRIVFERPSETPADEGLRALRAAISTRGSPRIDETQLGSVPAPYGCSTPESTI